MTAPSVFRRSKLIFPALCLLVAGVVGAADPYPHRIDPSVLESSRKGPNADVYFRREIPVLFRSDQAIDILNLERSSGTVLMLGKYHSARGTLDIELLGTLRDGTLEVAFPMGRLDAALFEWEELYSRPPALDDLNPRLRNLTFRGGEGFQAVYFVKRELEYQLTIDVPYDAATQALLRPRPAYAAASAFIRSLEKDGRSRTILQGNNTGLPIFISEGETPGAMAAGFLTSTIRQDEKGVRTYAYSSVLSRVSRLDEVKLLLKDPTVKAFVEGPQEVRVKAAGTDAKGFSFELSKEGGARLEATLVGKRVSVKP